MEQSRRLARTEKTTLRNLVEEGLLLAIERHTCSRKRLIKPVTFKGGGLSEEFRNASWNQIRQAAYEGRGA